MDKFDIIVNDGQHYIVGYAVVQKEKCEIFNFVSHTFRILRFLDGMAEWRIGGKIHLFHSGDIAIFNNLIKRNIHHVLTKNITYEFYDFLPSVLSNEILRNFFYSQTHKIAPQDDIAIQKINFLLDMLKSEIHSSNDPFQIFSIQKILDLLALFFYRNSEAQEPVVNAALSSVAKAIQYIQQHYCEDLNIRRLAKECGYSAEYFSRVFKKYMGIPPISYIVNLRLENVLHLISTRHISVLDAAYQSGFNSSSAFYKAFNAYKSTSPSKYIMSTEQTEKPHGY